MKNQIIGLTLGTPESKIVQLSCEFLDGLGNEVWIPGETLSYLLVNGWLKLLLLALHTGLGMWNTTNPLLWADKSSGLSGKFDLILPLVASNM
ncbi:hypothetical protein Pfo_014272 [Paulownia fortunei]|nr:hypothetical protein Pfo_014272 [Paulownia fortunei]